MSGVAALAPSFGIQDGQLERSIEVEAAALAHRIFEPREQRAQLAPPAVEQGVRMPALRHALAMRGALGQLIALDQRDALEMIGQHARHAHPADATADNYNMLRSHLYVVRRSHLYMLSAVNDNFTFRTNLLVCRIGCCEYIAV